jgi:hypothetical protein
MTEQLTLRAPQLEPPCKVSITYTGTASQGKI